MKNSLKFLIACCDPTIDDATLKQKYKRLKKKRKIIKLGFTHGIIPLLYQRLKDQPFIHKKINKELSQLYWMISQKNMLLSSKLIGINRAFQQDGIQLIAYKGALLSQQLYANITYRQFQDIDLFIQKEDILNAHNRLKKLGFESSTPIELLQNPLYVKRYYTCEYRDIKSNAVIELHWRLFKTKTPKTLENSEIMKSIQSLKIQSEELHTFSSWHLLYYLLIHGSKHRWERIEWIVDIDRMIRQEKISVDELLTKEHESYIHNMILLGLYTCYKLFNTPLSKSIKSQFKPLHKRLFNETLLMQKNSKSETSNNLRKLKFDLALRADTTEKLKFLYQIIFSINEKDMQSLALNEKQSFLYVVLRPLRLMTRYIKKVLHV